MVFYAGSSPWNVFWQGVLMSVVSFWWVFVHGCSWIHDRRTGSPGWWALSPPDASRPAQGRRDTSNKNGEVSTNGGEICWISNHHREEKMIIWMFPKMLVPQNGWFIMETLLKVDDLGYPYFWKHPIWFKGGSTATKTKSSLRKRIENTCFGITTRSVCCQDLKIIQENDFIFMLWYDLTWQSKHWKKSDLGEVGLNLPLLKTPWREWISRPPTGVVQRSSEKHPPAWRAMSAVWRHERWCHISIWPWYVNVFSWYMSVLSTCLLLGHCYIPKI